MRTSLGLSTSVYAMKLRVEILRDFFHPALLPLFRTMIPGYDMDTKVDEFTLLSIHLSQLKDFLVKSSALK